MSSRFDDGRRHFLHGAALALATAPLAFGRVAHAQGVPGKTALASLKQINAGVLDVGYAEDGPLDGPPIVLPHGWPYDIHAFVDVAPLLAKAGHRVIVPHLRGYGSTRFLSSETKRNGEQAALAVDIIALMDALRIEKAVVGAFDWGARTANIMAALWPERVKPWSRSAAI
jgi:pimeloyl-ACP methyl ester carboxylesterase